MSGHFVRIDFGEGLYPPVLAVLESLVKSISFAKSFS
jgi:hypothetical protein